MPSKPHLYQLWVKLSGHPSHFPLNARIFHSVCLIAFVALSYNVPFNYAIGLHSVALASLIVLMAMAVLYYLSRFKGKAEISIMITNILGLALFTVNYFLNSGLDGPTELFFLLFLLLSMGISPTWEYKFWIPVNAGIFTLLALVEYLSPESVPMTYQDRFSRFIDHISAYAVAAGTTYFCIDYIRRSYEREKRSALDKSKAIAEQNVQIVKQNQELEKLNAEKNKLMSIVAHDLRSPLGSIQNFLELLTEHDLDAQQKRDIEHSLLNSTKNTIAMLSKLLDWSKSQLNGFAINLQTLNLSKLLQQTLILEADIASRKNIMLSYEIDPSIFVFADGDMMQLVVRNIIGNAIKFTKPGGWITLHAENAGTHCVIAIRDNGIGIAEEKQQAIFSLDVKSTYGTGNEKGVGLGLILCMEFVHAQHGAIWFESNAGVGTTFYISIPITDSAAVAAQTL